MLKIGSPGTPSSMAILENAHGLARYAQICQVCCMYRSWCCCDRSSLHNFLCCSSGTFHMRHVLKKIARMQ